MFIKDATPNFCYSLNRSPIGSLRNRISRSIPTKNSAHFTMPPRTGCGNISHSKGHMSASPQRGLTTGTWSIYEIMEGDTFKIQLNGITEEDFLSIPSVF